jgi:hypothetical protein
VFRAAEPCGQDEANRLEPVDNYRGENGPLGNSTDVHWVIHRLLSAQGLFEDMERSVQFGVVFSFIGDFSNSV